MLERRKMKAKLTRDVTFNRSAEHTFAFPIPEGDPGGEMIAGWKFDKPISICTYHTLKIRKKKGETTIHYTRYINPWKWLKYQLRRKR